MSNLVYHKIITTEEIYENWILDETPFFDNYELRFSRVDGYITFNKVFGWIYDDEDAEDIPYSGFVIDYGWGHIVTHQPNGICTIYFFTRWHYPIYVIIASLHLFREDMEWYACEEDEIFISKFVWENNQIKEYIKDAEDVIDDSVILVDNWDVDTFWNYEENSIQDWEEWPYTDLFKRHARFDNALSEWRKFKSASGEEYEVCETDISNIEQRNGKSVKDHLMFLITHRGHMISAAVAGKVYCGVIEKILFHVDSCTYSLFLIDKDALESYELKLDQIDSVQLVGNGIDGFIKLVLNELKQKYAVTDDGTVQRKDCQYPSVKISHSNGRLCLICYSDSSEKQDYYKDDIDVFVHEAIVDEIDWLMEKSYLDYEEAKRIAFGLNTKWKFCKEYEDAYVFFERPAGWDLTAPPVAIMKSDGAVLKYWEYEDRHPNNENIMIRQSML